MPAYSNPEESRNAGIFKLIVLLDLMISRPFGIIFVGLSQLPMTSSHIEISLFVLLIVSLVLTRRGQFKVAIHIFPTGVWLILTLTSLLIYGVVRNPPVNSYILVILAGGLFSGGNTAWL